MKQFVLVTGWAGPDELVRVFLQSGPPELLLQKLLGSVYDRMTGEA